MLTNNKVLQADITINFCANRSDTQLQITNDKDSNALVKRWIIKNTISLPKFAHELCNRLGKPISASKCFCSFDMIVWEIENNTRVVLDNTSVSIYTKSIEECWVVEQ